MAQFARPIDNGNTNTGWSPNDVYAQINEVVPDDASFVTTGDDPEGASFTVKLSGPLAIPGPGAQVLRVRARKTDLGAPSAAGLKATLLKGGAIVADRIMPQPLPSEFTTFDFVLTTEQIAQIANDYSDLSLRVTATGLAVGCCGSVGMPESLLATFLNDSGCPGFIGQTIMLTYDATTGKWNGSGTFCDPSGTYTLSFYCLQLGTSCTDFRLDIQTDPISSCGGGTLWASQGCSCAPISIAFQHGNAGGTGCPCCTSGGPNAFTITITEPP